MVVIFAVRAKLPSRVSSDVKVGVPIGPRFTLPETVIPWGTTVTLAVESVNPAMVTWPVPLSWKPPPAATTPV